MRFIYFRQVFFIALMLLLTVKHAFSLQITENLRFRHLNVQNGLSNEKVLTLFQSSDGYIWIGTDDGLNRYDGSEIVKYKNNEFDKTSIAGNTIRKIYEDKAGRLWIGTNNGLCLYVKEFQNFIRYDFDPDKKDDDRNYIWNIYEDSNNTLWVGTLSGFFYFPPNLANYKQFFFSDAHGKRIPKIGVFNIAEYNRQFWVGTTNGIYVYNKELTLETFYPVNDKDSPTSNFASSFFIDKDNDFWIGTNWGLKKWDKHSATFIHYKEQLVYPGITSMCQDNKGYLWLGTKGGLNCITQKNPLKINYFKNQPANPNSLSDNFINCIFTDRSGIVWIGTNQGLSIIEEQYQAFHHIKDNMPTDESLQSNFIHCFLEDDNYLYLASRAGLDIYHKKLKNHIRHNHIKNNAFKNITAFLKINDNVLFSSVDGISIFNTKTQSIKTLYTLYSPTENKNVKLKDVQNLLQYNENSILVSVRNDGLYVIDYNFIIQKHYAHKTGDTTSLSHNVISSIVKDQNGVIWIGTRGGGLNRFDIRKGKFKTYMPDEKNPKSLSSKMINHLFIDKENTLWVGTKTGGLCKYNPQTDNFTTYKEREGLSSNYVVGLNEDGFDNIWISTGRGLSKFDKKTAAFRNFDVSDGLQGNTFNTGVVYKNKDGLIYFGGTNGYNIFDPKDIKTNSFPPIVDITNLSILNKLIVPGAESVLKKHVSKVDSILLKYNQNSFTFYFCALHFVRSDKNSFAFRLLGFENDWIFAGTKQHFANYSNIPPGKYYFQVKAANSDGVWTPSPKTIFIYIKPPFWITWWFRIFAFITVTGLIYSLHRLRVSTLEKRQLIIEAQKEQIEILAQKEHELNELKLTFFANISHELRTPLSLILGPLDKLLASTTDAQLKSQYTLMHRNAQRLMKLLNQILDFRKLDLGKLTLEPSETDIVKFTRLIVADFYSLSEIQKTKLTFSASHNFIKVKIDKDKYEQIISNLLVNAFKFTPGNGTVSVDISVNESSDVLIIKISDNGEGINKEDVGKIFSLFFQSENKKGGFGIGLALSHNLIKMHGGDIAVESEKGKGTTFTITLPLDANAIIGNELPEPEISEPVTINQDFTVPAPDPKQTKKPETQQTILIVEDNYDLRNFIREELDDTYNILEADNGRDGIKLAVDEMPDLIISDIMMPEADGLELCTTLKENMVTSHIPIILLTARSAQEHQQEGFEHGADDYILKPFNAKILKLKIHNQLKLIQQLREKYIKKVDFNIDSSIQTINSPNDVFLERIASVIENNISDKDYSITQFAKDIGISERQLFRKIKVLTDYSPNDFIKVNRLRIAKRILLEKELTIAEVAYYVGFNSPGYFTQCFKDQFGVTPKEFLAQKD